MTTVAAFAFRFFGVAGRVALAALLFLPVFGSPLAAQSGRQGQRPGATFRVEATSVEVDVTVTDAQGNFVRDLQRDEFQVLEDGKPQKIAAFGLIDLPATRLASAASAGAGTTAAPEPDVASNEAAAEGRVYVLVLDDVHTHPLRSARTKEVARRFVEQYLGPGDMAAVVHTSGRADAGQEFTNNRRLLLAAIDRFTGRKLRSSVLARLEEYERQRAVGSNEGSRADIRLGRVMDPLEAERAAQARGMLESLKNIAALLDNVRGRRKGILLISEGVDYDLEGDVAQTSSGISTFTNPNSGELRQRMREAITAAARSNATIYSIDPRGLAGTGDDMIEVTNFPENPHLGLTPTTFQEELRRAQDTLRVLAEETGGAASVSSNDFTGIYERVVRDNSTYYMLGYTPSNERRDGRYRRIEVRVTRPGVQVRARKGYSAPSGKENTSQLVTTGTELPPALREALNRPVPTPGLVLRAYAVPFRGEKEPSVLVGVEADASRFKFEQKDGTYNASLQVALAALDDKGKFHGGDTHSVNMQLKPETYEAVKARGLRLLFRLNLRPGRYQIRAAAYERAGAATGSVHYDLQVPDYSKATPVGVSGLVLTSARATLTPTALPDPALAQVLPGMPTAARDFTSDDRIGAYLEIYPGGNAPALQVTTSVVAADGRVVFRSEGNIESETLRQAQHGYGWMTPVPLADVTPGPYVLRIEIKSAAGQAVTTREVPIAIREAGAK